MVSSVIRGGIPDKICWFLRYQHHDSSYIWARLKAFHSYKWKRIHFVRHLWWLSSLANHSRQVQFWSWMSLLRALSSQALSTSTIPRLFGQPTPLLNHMHCENFSGIQLEFSLLHLMLCPYLCLLCTASKHLNP